MIRSTDPSPDDEGGASDALVTRKESGGRSDIVEPETSEGWDERILRDHETIDRWVPVYHEITVYSPATCLSTGLPQISSLPHFGHFDRPLYGMILDL